MGRVYGGSAIRPIASAGVRLLLVRHGESEWNALGRWQGQADPPLSPRGHEQARAAAVALKAFRPDAIVSSTLVRAIQTAAAFSDELDVSPLYLERDLIERDSGEWSGLTRDEIEARYPGFLAGGRRPRGYEPDSSVLARTLAAVERVIARLDAAGTVVVVTHGGIIYALEQHLGAPFVRKPNLGARWFEHDGSVLRLGEVVELLDPASATTPDLL